VNHRDTETQSKNSVFGSAEFGRSFANSAVLAGKNYMKVLAGEKPQSF
jgi:hypothetical protein